MKIASFVVLALLLCSAAYGQTEDLGMGAFANEEGPILLAVDTALVNLKIDSPYVMFVIYMAPKNQNQQIVVTRDTIALIHQGREYKMPPFDELRKNYGAEIHDLDFYRHLGKEGLVSSWIRMYSFQRGTDFFPPLTMRSPLAVDEGSMYGFIGFRTRAYFKNPGFKPGDQAILRVWDKKDPNLKSEVHFVLK